MILTKRTERIIKSRYFKGLKLANLANCDELGYSKKEIEEFTTKDKN